MAAEYDRGGAGSDGGTAATATADTRGAAGATRRQGVAAWKAGRAAETTNGVIAAVAAAATDAAGDTTTTAATTVGGGEGAGFALDYATAAAPAAAGAVALATLAGALLARSMFGDTRMFNLTITSVPGPQQRLYAFGAPLAEILPLVPLFAEHTVGIAVVTYAG